MCGVWYCYFDVVHVYNVFLISLSSLFSLLPSLFSLLSSPLSLLPSLFSLILS